MLYINYLRFPITAVIGVLFIKYANMIWTWNKKNI